MNTLSRTAFVAALLLSAAAALAADGHNPDIEAPVAGPRFYKAAPPVPDAAAMAVTVYKTPWCGCCHAWAEAVAKGGYQASTRDLEDLSAVRMQAGVPADMEGCHVAEVDGYFLEGHVPLEAIVKLLSERPEIAGLAVPGMPQGSLGMGDDSSEAYDVYSVPCVSSKTPPVFYEAGSQE